MKLSKVASKPSKVIGAGALAGAITIVAAWALKTYASTELTVEVAGAVQLILTYLVQQVTDDQ